MIECVIRTLAGRHQIDFRPDNKYSSPFQFVFTIRLRKYLNYCRSILKIEGSIMPQHWRMCWLSVHSHAIVVAVNHHQGKEGMSNRSNQCIKLWSRNNECPLVGMVVWWFEWRIECDWPHKHTHRQLHCITPCVTFESWFQKGSEQWCAAGLIIWLGVAWRQYDMRHGAIAKSCRRRAAQR